MFVNMYYVAPWRPLGRKHPRAAASDAGLRGRVFSMWKSFTPDQPLPARRIGSILRGTGPSGALADEARVLARMERTVHRLLGRESVPHVRAAGLSEDTLKLLADSPAWASIARFHVPDICAALASELPRVQHARVAVMNTEARLEAPPAAGPGPISPVAARALRSAARSIENPRLARILFRLAGRERPPADQRSASAIRSRQVNWPQPAGRI